MFFEQVKRITSAIVHDTVNTMDYLQYQQLWQEVWKSIEELTFVAVLEINHFGEKKKIKEKSEEVLHILFMKKNTIKNQG